MQNTDYQRGDRYAARYVRKNGVGAVIAMPVECLGKRYERYIDRTTGIITLVPDTGVKTEEKQ